MQLLLTGSQGQLDFFPPQELNIDRLHAQQ